MLQKSRRPEGQRLRVSASGDDATVRAGALGVGRDREGRCEMQIALEREPQRAMGG